MELISLNIITPEFILQLKANIMPRVNEFIYVEFEGVEYKKRITSVVYVINDGNATIKIFTD